MEAQAAATEMLARAEEVFRQARDALAILNGVVSPHGKDSLPKPLHGTLLATANAPARPAPVQDPIPATHADLDVTPRGAMVQLAANQKRAPPPVERQGPLFPPPKPKRDARIGAQIKKRAQKMFHEDAEAAMAEWEATKVVLAELAFISNPYVARGRQLMAESHCSTLELYQPSLTEEQHWHTDVLLEYACLTLHFRIKTSRGQNGGPIQSRTAISWLGHHVFNICTYGRHPDTGELGGLSLLRRGLYGRLENVVKWSVIEYGLGRHIGKQQGLDCLSTRLVIEHIIASSETNGRHPALQTLGAIGLAMFGAFCSGTLQANHPDYREQKMYMQAGHLKFHIRGWCSWAVEVSALNWKGYSGWEGQRKTLVFEPVTKAHNIIFEPAPPLLLDYLIRGFIKGVNDIDSLLACKETPLPLVDDCLEKPVFLKRTSRGFKVIEGVPCGPHKLSQTINHHAVAVGLRRGSIHDICWASAEHYVQSMGRDRTLFLMNHERPGMTLDNHYALQEHVPYVGIRLGELDGHLGEVERETMRNQELGSPALTILARHLQSTHPMGTEIMKESRYRITEEEEEAILNDPKMADLLDKAKDEWNRFVKLYPKSNEPFVRHFMSTINRVKSHDTTASPVLIDMHIQNLTKLSNKLKQERRQAFKRIRRAHHKATSDAPVSVNLLKQAQEQAKEPSVLFDQEDLRAEISKYLKTQQGQASEAMDEDDTLDEEEQGVLDGQEPLPGQGLPPPATVVSGDKPRISQLNVSLQSAPNVTLPEPAQPKIPEFNDSTEHNVLKIDAPVMRAIYMRFLFKAHKQQTLPVEFNADGKLICKTCPQFFSRRDSPADFTFTNWSHFNRHMRERHDEWSNLELEMQTDDPKRFKCPGCDDIFSSVESCKKHSRHDCVESCNFMRLYEEHQSKRKRETNDDLARRDREKEKGMTGTTIVYEEDTPEVLATMQADLKRPGFLEEWATLGGGDLSEACPSIIIAEKQLTVKQDVSRGHRLEDLQQLASQSIEIALGGEYRSGPEDNVPIQQGPQPGFGPVIASGPGRILEIRDEALEAFNTSNPENMSDYDTESD